MYSRGAWIQELSLLSVATKRISGQGPLPEVEYKNPASGVIDCVDAFNFCHDHAHNEALARALEFLAANGASDAELKKYLTDLTSGRDRQTCGALCELLVFDWLAQHDASFETQVPVSGTDVLNPSGSHLDGKLTHLSEVYFDIKTFGFQEVMVTRLQARLEADQPGSWIAIDGSWDVSAEDLQDLLEHAGYSRLLADLRAQTSVKRGVLHFIRRPKSSVQVSSHSVDPYAAAEKHGSHVFRFAKQFTRHKPFILFLAHHPWLGGQTLSSNFARHNSIYMRSVARRTFIQHLNDNSIIKGETKADVSRLISCIAFLNICHIPFEKGGPDPKHARLSIYVNPNATNRLPQLALRRIKSIHPHAIIEEDFAHDNY